MIDADPGELIEECLGILASFKPAKTSLDAHATDVLGIWEGAAAPAEARFVKQVFDGCVSQKKALKLFLSHFYHANSATVARSDYTLYMVFAYISLFRLAELGWDQFRVLVLSQDSVKMAAFLEYTFDAEVLGGALHDDFVLLFDPDYVESELFGTLLAHAGKSAALIEYIQDKAYGATLARKEQARAAEEATRARKLAALTKPVAPKLTVPRPRLVAEPMRIEQKVKTNAVPSYLDRTSLAKLARAHEERKAAVREEAARKHAGASAPKLHETKSKLAEIAAAVEEERSAPLRVRFKAKPAPKFDEPAPVKMTAAAILREDALYRRKAEDAAALIKAYESELRDASGFHAWQVKMRAKDRERTLKEVEQRRAEMAAAQAEAVEASARRRLHNRKLARLMKEESVAMKEKKVADDEERLLRGRAKVEDVREVRDSAPRAARERVREENIAKAEALADELAERRALAAEEDAAEQLVKEDRIRQIRALERAPVVKEKFFDPTTTAGLGLLDEMSMVEMKLRIKLEKELVEREREEKRAEVERKKAARAKNLRGRAAGIAKRRAAAAASNRALRARKLAAAKEKAAKEKAARDASNVVLAERLEAKRMARHHEQRRIVEEETRLAKRKMFLGAAKSMLEEKQFTDLLAGRQREAAVRQARKKEEALKMDAVQRKETEKRHVLLARSRRDDERKKMEQREKLTHSRAYARERARLEVEAKRQLAKEERDHERKATTALAARNPYALEQTRRLQKKAKARAARRVRFDASVMSPPLDDGMDDME
eukprot:PLAT8795.1.p1 GENE.PLAT8795.1~~PLAT8795.1.p1  ORF type:complete len:780 (-),score=486.96 PLAT8795.1:74-2413(-)